MVYPKPTHYEMSTATEEQYTTSELTEKQIILMNAIGFTWSWLPPNWIRSYRDMVAGNSSA